MPVSTFPDLPVTAALPALLDALKARSSAVLVAPPGAGKTTLVPLALLDQSWRRDGKIILLEPRRLAARAAARRMAQLLGEEPGATVGYAMRMDTRQSAATKILVVTEGILARMILDDRSSSAIRPISTERPLPPRRKGPRVRCWRGGAVDCRGAAVRDNSRASTTRRRNRSRVRSLRRQARPGSHSFSARASASATRRRTASRA